MRLILDLCGGTGEWSRPYREDPSYDVVLIDLATSGQDIALTLPPRRGTVYGILAAPPCTDLAASGARHWASKGPEALTRALAVADACLRYIALCEPVFWALENPKGRLSRYYGKPTLIFDPYFYGDPYRKKTLLWGKFNAPALNPVEPVSVCPQGSWLQRLGGYDREKTRRLRSMTPPGFARAFYEANR